MKTNYSNYLIHQNATYTSPNFKGGGRLSAKFSQAFIRSQHTLSEISKAHKDLQIVGTLPPEFISKLKETCKTQKELKNKIAKLYFTFRVTADFLWHKLSVNDTLAQAATNILNNGLKEAGILGKRETASIKSIGDGNFANCYNITFSNKKYSPKVIKIFKALCVSDTADFNRSGILAETNTAAYIKKARGHKPTNFHTPEFYFSDIKQEFMLFENANNYKAPVTTTPRRVGIKCHDEHSLNLVNGRLVDMGEFYVISGLESIVKNSRQRRVYKRLAHAYKDCLVAHECKLKKRSLTQKAIESIKAFFGYPVVREVDMTRYKKAFYKEYELAITNKTPQAWDVLKALEVAKNHLVNPEEVVIFVKGKFVPKSLYERARANRFPL